MAYSRTATGDVLDLPESFLLLLDLFRDVLHLGFGSFGGGF